MAAAGRGRALGRRVDAELELPLPILLSDLGVKRMLDAPCGDYNWFKPVPRGETVEYIGGDIVHAIVDRNSHAHADVRTSFVQMDITKDDLPPVDLWLCRDALFHLSDELAAVSR